MGFALADDGVRIHYEVLGRSGAPPLLCLQGLGAGMQGWMLQVPALVAHYRLVLVDNRGVGRSDKPYGRYDLLEMADDAVRVLDAAGVERAHVMGASMGGVLAQILAVRHPDRVASMVLACTACRHLPWRRELLAEWAEVAQEQGMRALAGRAMRWLVGGRSFRRFWPAIGTFGPLVLTAPAHGFVGQVRAILTLDDSIRDELSTVQAPTLVIVGSQDILTPRGDAEEIAEHIPGAELVVVSGAAHGFFVEHFVTFNRQVSSFLARVEAARTAEAASAAPALPGAARASSTPP